MNSDSFSYPPRGLGREAAARYVGIDATGFAAMVADGRMPRPKSIEGREIWDRIAIDEAFSDLPTTGTDRSRNTRGTSEASPGRSDKPYTPRSLAEELGCSERHIRNLCASGELRSFKLGDKLLRIRRDEVEAYLARQP